MAALDSADLGGAVHGARLLRRVRVQSAHRPGGGGLQRAVDDCRHDGHGDAVYPEQDARAAGGDID